MPETFYRFCALLFHLNRESRKGQVLIGPALWTPSRAVHFQDLRTTRLCDVGIYRINKDLLYKSLYSQAELKSPMDPSLEERLTIPFGTLIQLERVEHCLRSIAQQLHCGIEYKVTVHKHVGTTHPEVSPDTFQTKKDKTNMRGTFIGFYVVGFDVPAYEGGYYQIQCDQPMKVEKAWSSNDWPEEYYRFVDEIRKATQNYLTQEELPLT